MQRSKAVRSSGSIFSGHSRNTDGAPATADRSIPSVAGRPRLRELDHLFVHNLRFWSMVSIIAVHCSREFEFARESSPTHLGIAIITTFKFGTIGFFLVSGFLLGERVDSPQSRRILHAPAE